MITCFLGIVNHCPVTRSLASGSPEEEHADERVEKHVAHVVSHGAQLVQPVVEPEGEHAERPVGLVALLLQPRLANGQTRDADIRLHIRAH